VTIAHSTRSCGSFRPGNRPGRATRSKGRKVHGRTGDRPPGRRTCEPNASEPDSTSLRLLVVTSLPKMAKSEASGEAMSASTHWTTRGDWGGRVRTDRAENCETRCRESDRRERCRRRAMAPSSRVRRKGRKRKCESTTPSHDGGRQRARGIHNPGCGCSRESDRPIVARKRGNARGAKGPNFSHVFVKERKPA
jgi:hypothetical protein